MSATASSRFRVAEVTDSHIWLEVTSKPGKGFQIAVPTESVEYDDELRRKLHSLEEGETVEAELESENERNTAWYVCEIDGDPSGGGSTRSAPADD